MNTKLLLLLFSLQAFSLQIFPQQNPDLRFHQDLTKVKLQPYQSDSLSHNLFKQNDFNSPSEKLYETWDSTQWNEDERTLFTYDEEENLIEEKVQIRNGSDWINETRILYGYENGNPTFDEHHKWNGTEWLNDWRNTTAYDGNGYPVSYSTELGDSLSWIYVWRNLYYRNNTNHLIDSAKYEVWDSEWLNGSLTKYFYTTDGRDSITIYGDFPEAEWEPGARRVYTYDDATISYDVLLQQWSGTEWVNDGWSTYTYDSNDNLVEESFKLWEDTEWENWYRNIYSYNAQNLNNEYKRQVWNGLGWATDWRWIYEYDSNNNRTLYRRENYDFGNWIGLWQFVYEYDSNNLLTISTRQKWDGTVWVNDYRDRYFYEPSTSVEEEVIADGFHLYNNYPNPFNPTTRISWQSAVSSWQTLKIYDVLGKEVATLVNEEKPAGKYEIEFNASGLSSGIYFYQLQTNNLVETKKMTLLR